MLFSFSFSFFYCLVTKIYFFNRTTVVQWRFTWRLEWWLSDLSRQYCF
jgi:hypothetical protein